MKNNSNTSEHGLSPLRFRLITLVFGLCMLAAGLFSVYWLWEHVLPLYGRVYRGAPIVETPYLAFGLVMVPPVSVICVLAAAICMWTGKKFDPPHGSILFKLQSLMFATALKMLLYVVPVVIIVTTALLLIRDYTPCPKLLISGSAWQLFWVNDERACFKPTRYINGNWPCRIVGNQEVCILSDGK